MKRNPTEGFGLAGAQPYGTAAATAVAINGVNYFLTSRRTLVGLPEFSDAVVRTNFGAGPVFFLAERDFTASPPVIGDCTIANCVGQAMDAGSTVRGIAPANRIGLAGRYLVPFDGPIQAEVSEIGNALIGQAAFGLNSSFSDTASYGDGTYSNPTPTTALVIGIALPTAVGILGILPSFDVAAAANYSARIILTNDPAETSITAVAGEVTVFQDTFATLKQVPSMIGAVVVNTGFKYARVWIDNFTNVSVLFGALNQ